MPACAAESVDMSVAPFGLSGSVYVALINHRPALDALGAAVHAPPYGAPPRAPVLGIKPRNTLLRADAAVPVPRGHTEVDVGVQVAMVIGRAACRVAPARALEHVAGYLLIADVSLQVTSHYRPAIRERARDGSCPLGPAVVPAGELDLERLAVRLAVRGRQDARERAGAGAPGGGGQAVWESETLVRTPAALLAEVSDFMTLSAGDVLGLGAAAPSPRARAGDVLEVTAAGFPSWTLRFEAERT